MSFGFLNSQIFPTNSPSIADLRSSAVRHHPQSPKVAQAQGTPPKLHIPAQHVLSEEQDEDISAMPPFPQAGFVPDPEPEVRKPSVWARFKERAKAIFKRTPAKQERPLVIGAPLGFRYMGGHEVLADSIKACQGHIDQPHAR